MIRNFFRDLLPNFFALFKPKNLVWHVSAIGITFGLVLGGVDWQYFELTRSDAFHWIVYGAGIGGFFVPVLVPLVLYFIGEYRADRHLMNTALTAAQASLIAYVVSAIYKVFTGRTQPEFLTQFSNVDISHAFHFGILQNGIFWGWPSSHAAVAFAGATALALMIRSRSIRTLAFAYAIFVGVGASIGFHWLSDVLAGAIFGILVGTIVAKSFQHQ